MRICVFGAGAIGGYMAGELALAGHDVCAIARGAHLAAIRSHGLKLIVEGRTRTAHLPASDDPVAFGPQDVVICALKAQQAHASAGCRWRPESAFIRRELSKGLKWRLHPEVRCVRRGCVKSLE